ncbi:MAG: PEP-CTERM sorting domain-containing protein [Bryobacteraceae bacterium]
MKITILLAGLVAACSMTASAAALIGIDPPSNLIVSAGGLEWVYAAPCAPGGCGTITLHHGFRLPTDSEWLSSFTDLNDLFTKFGSPSPGKCAAPYFSDQWDHCDFGDLQSGYVYNSPFAPDDAHRLEPNGETFLVRGEGGEIPEPATYALVGAGLAGVMVRRKRARARG